MWYFEKRLLSKFPSRRHKLGILKKKQMMRNDDTIIMATSQRSFLYEIKTKHCLERLTSHTYVDPNNIGPF